MRTAGSRLLRLLMIYFIQALFDYGIDILCRRLNLVQMFS